jgi:hypothetical protein
VAAESLGYIADGTIYPSRFVKQSTGTERVVAVTAATDSVIGVADERVKYLPGLAGVTPPYPAAEQNDPLKVYGATDFCLIETGAAVTGGQFLIPDSVGRAVPLNAAATTGVQYVGARAFESATTSGVLIRAQVLISPFPGI